MSFGITTSAWAHGSAIPRQFTCDGEDRSPPLQFVETPLGTRSFALIFDDPDAPVGTWVHWVIYNIPAGATGLPQAVRPDAELPDGSRHGKNSWGKLGYGGPCPPRGKPHRYFFKLYALGAPLSERAGLSAQDLERAMRGKVLGQGELMGTYERG